MPNDSTPAKSANSIASMYADYFLDYASYVILERAVPHISDGLKPVQRRILHALERMDDGRYNKVANLVGDTMKYHPHGDASIGEAVIGIGQKGYLIDPQGNWGNVLTGDPAAAPRYIEARLSKFAKQILFSPKITEWQLSYDGRNKEPVTLPVKFPLLLLQGAEGIAVGLACKILPHNFAELCQACIAALRGESFELYPDFITGGIMDAGDYRDGMRGGGRVRVRARISKVSAKLLKITEVPFGVTASSMIDSIVAAAEKGKLKLAKVEDNTAANVEVLVHLPPGSDPEQTEQALYAFSDCEVSISPNACVILDNKPNFMGVSEIVRWSAQRTREVLGMELELQLGELRQSHYFASLERIFIEQRIYRDIEDCESWKQVLKAIFDGLQPFIKDLYREPLEEDIVRLTEIKIKRISRYDSKQAEANLQRLVGEIQQCEKNLANLTRFTVKWFESLHKNFAPLFPRRTEISSFATVNRTQAAVANETLYLDAVGGFAGWGLKKETPLEKCSTLDDLLIISSDGKMRVTKIAEKLFVGKKPLKVMVYRKEEDLVINLVYRDGRNGHLMAKRFRVGGITRDKEYELTQGSAGSRIFHLSFHKSEEDSSSVELNIFIKPLLRLRNLVRGFKFAEIAVKGRSAKGNIICRHAVERVARNMQAQSDSVELLQDGEQNESSDGQSDDNPALHDSPATSAPAQMGKNASSQAQESEQHAEVQSADESQVESVPASASAEVTNDAAAGSTAPAASESASKSAAAPKKRGRKPAVPQDGEDDLFSAL